MNPNEDKVWELPPKESPLRSWGDSANSQLAILDLNILIQSAAAEEAFSRLLQDMAVTKDDLVAIGRLNFHAFVRHYEPVAALWDDVPRLDPDIRRLLLSR